MKNDAILLARERTEEGEQWWLKSLNLYFSRIGCQKKMPTTDRSKTPPPPQTMYFRTAELKRTGISYLWGGQCRGKEEGSEEEVLFLLYS